MKCRHFTKLGRNVHEINIQKITFVTQIALSLLGISEITVYTQSRCLTQSYTWKGFKIKPL